MWYSLNSPMNHMKDHKKLELLSIGSELGTMLVNVY